MRIQTDPVVPDRRSHAWSHLKGRTRAHGILLVVALAGSALALPGSHLTAETGAILPVLLAAACIALAGWALLGLIEHPRAAIGAAVVWPLIAAAVLALADPAKRTSLVAVWMVLVGILFGLTLGRRWRPHHAVYAERGGLAALRLEGSAALALLAVVVGAALRVYGLDFGLPEPYHPDEIGKGRIVARMARTGSFDPNYFLHPTQLLYLSLFTSKILAALGVYADHDSLRAIFAGRLVSATAGSISIALTYFVGRRLLSAYAGGFAALLLAIFPLHVTCSRYFKEDVLFTMWLLAALAAMLKAVDERRVSFLYLAGLLAGFSVGSKYTGVMAAGVLLAAPFLRSRHVKPDVTFLKHSLLAALCVVAGFLLSCPYSVLTHEKFLRHAMFEGRHILRGHSGIAIDAWSHYWMFHWQRSIVPGATFLPAFVSLVGVGILLWRRRAEDLLLVVLLLAFYLPAEYGRSKPMPQPDRYMVPALPFVALLASECVRLWGRHLWRAVLALAIALPPTARSVELAAHLRPDTRQRMAAWIGDHVPQGAGILMIGERAYLPRISRRAYHYRTVHPRALRDYTVDLLPGMPFEYLLIGSFTYDRYFQFTSEEHRTRRRLQDYDEHLTLIAEVSAPRGSYGFHNPTFRLYAIPRNQD